MTGPAITGPLTTGSARIMGTRPDVARPQLVVEDAHEPGTYLGATGWTKQRAIALEFATHDAATTTIANMRRDHPSLFAKREALDVVSRAFDPTLVVGR